MKKLTGLLSVLVAIAAAYTGFWFYQSQKVKDLVVSHLKEYEKPDADGYQLKVADVSTGGFPFNYEINLNNPTYQSAQDANAPPAVLVDGKIKVGTDVLGTTFWLKKEGDLKFNQINEEGKTQELVLKGNADVKVEVLHPEYTKSLIEPLKNFPKQAFTENFSWEAFFREVKSITYTDSNFELFAKDDIGLNKIIDFNKSLIEWKHSPTEQEENVSFKLNLIGLEASDQGKALSSFLRKNWGVGEQSDVAYFVGSGKNDINIDFVANLPKNIDHFDFSNYKNGEIAVKNFSMKNQYGRSNVSFNLTLSEKDKDIRILHLGLNTESSITKEGALAMHSQFINGIKQQVAQEPNDPQTKLFSELLKCCEAQLDNIIPDYTKLGKIKFEIDSDLKIRNIQGIPNLQEIVVAGINFITDPYSIKSSGNFNLEKDQASGKYAFNWINYKDMIHDLIAYFNRIHPILTKIVESNGQQMSVAVLSPTQENEIIDFFKSLSDNHESDGKDIKITMDFQEATGIKIGSNSIQNVMEAFNKLLTDLQVNESVKKLEVKEPLVDPKISKVPVK